MALKSMVFGTPLKCTFGLAPMPIRPLPIPRAANTVMPEVTIMDIVPMVNIGPFGLCTSLTNPTVAAATAAAMGVLTPMPCIPVTPTPWVPPEPNRSQAVIPNVSTTACLFCAWGGVIKAMVDIQFNKQLVI